MILYITSIEQKLSRYEEFGSEWLKEEGIIVSYLLAMGNNNILEGEMKFDNDKKDTTINEFRNLVGERLAEEFNVQLKIEWGKNI